MEYLGKNEYFIKKYISTMRVIGIDPSINSTGVCVRDGDTYIYYIISSKTTKKMDSFVHKYVSILKYIKDDTKNMEYSDKEYTKTNNYLRIIDHLKNIIEKHKPERIIMEGISYGSVSGSSLVDLAGINFLIRSLCIQYGIPYTIVSPTSLKKFVCANGQAEKEVIIESWKRMDKNINNITDIKIDDLADAFFLSNYTV